MFRVRASSARNIKNGQPLPWAYNTQALAGSLNGKTRTPFFGYDESRYFTHDSK